MRHPLPGLARPRLSLVAVASVPDRASQLRHQDVLRKNVSGRRSSRYTIRRKSGDHRYRHARLCQNARPSPGTRCELGVQLRGRRFIRQHQMDLERKRT